MGLSYWQYGLRENVEGRCRGQRFWGGRKKKVKYVKVWMRGVIKGV